MVYSITIPYLKRETWNIVNNSLNNPNERNVNINPMMVVNKNNINYTNLSNIFTSYPTVEVKLRTEFHYKNNKYYPSFGDNKLYEDIKNKTIMINGTFLCN